MTGHAVLIGAMVAALVVVVTVLLDSEQPPRDGLT